MNISIRIKSIFEFSETICMACTHLPANGYWSANIPAIRHCIDIFYHPGAI